MRWSRCRPKRAFVLSGLMAAFVLMGAGGGVSAAAPFDENRPKVGDKAHEFEIQGFRLSDLKGKKNLLMVFYRGHF